MGTSTQAPGYPLDRAVTRSGDLLYDAPNATFFFYLPVALTAAGLTAWFIPGNITFLLCTFVGSIVAILCLWELIIVDGPIRFSRVMAMTLLLGYALGALNSWFTIPRGSMTLAEFFIQDPQALARAQGAVLFACATLLCLGEVWEKPLFRRDFKIDFDNRVIAFCILSTLITLAAYATRSLAFMGAVITASHELGVFPTLAIWVITPAFGLTVAAALNTRFLSQRVMLAALSVVQVFCILPLSRRTLLYSLLIAIVSMRFARLRFKLSASKKIMTLALAGGLFYSGNIAFYYLRVTTWHERSPGTASITQLGGAAIRLSQQSQAATILRSLHENEETRTFILGYFSDVLNGSLNLPTAHGVDLMHQINDAMPRALNPGKSDVRYLAEEQISADYFGLKGQDQANSVLTGGAIDFGMLGVFTYPICLALVVRAFLYVLAKFVPPWISTVVALVMTMSFLQPENEFGAVFVDARNSLLFTFFLLALAATPRFRLSLKISR